MSIRSPRVIPLILDIGLPYLITRLAIFPAPKVPDLHHIPPLSIRDSDVKAEHCQR